METMQVVSEFEPVVALYRLARPGRVLEIGCWDGGTLKVWMEEADPQLVVAVDLWHRNRDAYEEWCKPGTDLHLYTGPSQEQEQIAAIRSHAPYDWVLIDGDHADGPVRSDVGVCLPLIRPGGMMLLHDIEAAAGSDKAPSLTILEELAADGYATEMYVDPKAEPWSHGIGVVRL